MSDAKIDKII